jgi:transcriptional regulator with XRE-family HTH domain
MFVNLKNAFAYILFDFMMKVYIIKANDTSGEIIMRIQDKIKTNRKNKGLSQKQLAEMVGINTSHLSRLENGRYQPSVEVLKKLADALQVSTDYLLSATDDEAEEIRIQDQSFADKIRLLDSLDGKEKETVINVIDAMLTKKKMLNLLTEKHEHV